VTDQSRRAGRGGAAPQDRCGGLCRVGSAQASVTLSRIIDTSACQATARATTSAPTCDAAARPDRALPDMARRHRL